MSTATFRWSVSTPDARVASGECDFVVIPTVTGELGVMAGHAALVARVAPGDVRVTRAGSPSTVVTVGYGLVDVRDNVVTLLVEQASAPRPA